ncbi:MAG: hypothetical protein ACHQAX_03550 [Gammaproteobacteria bacterium]
MLEKFQNFINLFQKKVIKSSGLLSIYIGVGFVTFAYSKKSTEQPVISIMERVSLEGSRLQEVLSAFMSQHGLSNVRCMITLNPMDYRLIYLDAPNVDDEELGAAAKWLVKEFINFPLSNAAVDAFRVPVRAGQPSKMYAVVAQLDRIKSIVDACAKASMEVISIDIAELSLRNLMQLLQEDKGEVGFLFMRPDFHAVLISSNDTLCFSRTVETKAQYQSDNAEQNVQTIDYLVREIERSLHFYQSNIGNNELSKIWISTELENQDALVTALSENMEIGCEALDFNRFFKIENGVDLSSAVQGAIALGGLLRQE